jgi:site-specific recombinase XerD
MKFKKIHKKIPIVLNDRDLNFTFHDCSCLATKQSKLKPMANINKPSKKTSNKDFLKVPDITFFNRFQKVYLRFLSFNKDAKIALNIRLPKGATIDKKTGIAEGYPEITTQILTYAKRFDVGFRRSVLDGIEPTIDWLKTEMFGINHGLSTPTLLVALNKYFEHYYGQKSNLNKKTKEKNGYCLRYIEAWLLTEFLSKTVHLADIKPIHAEKLFYYIINSMSVSREHSRRTVGFLDRALKFAVKSGWLVSHPFQYVLNEKQFQRQKKDITKYLSVDELEKIENAEIHVEELARIRDWFVLACHTGFEWHNFHQFKKSWIKHDKDGLPYLEGERFKEINGYGEPFLVPVNEKANTLINKFLAESDPNSDSLFQNMPDNTWTNRLLKQVEVLAGVNRKISFNFSRKTFSTNAINAGIRAEILQKMTGHSRIETLLGFYAEIKRSTILKEGRF